MLGYVLTTDQTVTTSCCKLISSKKITYWSQATPRRGFSGGVSGRAHDAWLPASTTEWEMHIDAHNSSNIHVCVVFYFFPLNESQPKSYTSNLRSHHKNIYLSIYLSSPLYIAYICDLLKVQTSQYLYLHLIDYFTSSLVTTSWTLCAQTPYFSNTVPLSWHLLFQTALIGSLRDEWIN